MATYVPLFKTLAAVKQYKPGYQLGGRKQGGLSEYEQALLPHVQEAEAQKERKLKWLQPIELVFDLLSRGQYMTANTAKQITRNIREGKPVLEGVPREAWEGITGKEKGDWGTLLWGGQDKGGEQFSGWAQKAGENLEKTWIGRRAKGGAALGLNILLDPTTYLGAGPARGAKTAAAEATKDAVKIATRKIAADVSEKLAGQGVKELGGEVFEKGMQAALLKGGDAPQKFLAKHLGRDIDREMSQLIKRTQKETLRLPAAEVRKKMLGEAESVLERTKTNKLDAMAKAGKPYAEAIDVLMDQAPELQDLSSIIQKIKSGQAYGGAGTRSMRFMRKEFATGERYPALVHAWDRATEKLAGSKVGTLFNNAWWSIMNDPKSPLATIKKAFNIRTPYQQYLANLQLEKTAMGVYLRDDYARNYFNAVKDLKPEDKIALRDAWSQIQRDPDANILDTMLKSGVDTKQAAKIQQAYTKVQGMFNEFDGWFKTKYAEDPTLFPDGEIGTIANYLPMVGKRPEGLGFFGRKTGISPVREGFTQKRVTTFPQMEDLEKKVWRIMEPRLTDDQIEVLLKKYNLGRYVNMDLDEMVMARIFAQSRAQQNVALIEQFRQFGLNLNDVKASDPVIAEALGRGAPDFGLVNVPDPRLEGYLFDPSVADILKRATTIGEGDATIRQFEKYLNSFTSWWKGWATLSPGFHFRNYYSNTVTGFLKHGTDWLNPATQFHAGVATLYGLYGEDAFKYFGKMGLSEDAARGILGQKFGDYTMGELAQLARQRGIITKATMGFDVAQGVEAFTKQANLNPLSSKFAPMQASKDIGTIIESQPRFLSFLLDYKTSVGQGAATDAAIDWAGWEAKKWFIDYTDLSPFEQKVLKNIIPFYCFDTETEVLTPRGWVRYDTILKGEPIFTVNLETQEIELQTVNDVATFDYDGELIRLETRNIDALLTPNHRCIVDKYCPEEGHFRDKWEIKEAKDLVTSDWLPIATEGWRPKTKAIYSDDFVEMVGWIVCEGTINDTYVNLSQSHKNCLQQIRWCLLRLGWDYSEAERNGVVYMNLRKPQADLFRNLIGNPKKLPLSFVMQLTREQLEILWRTLINGDGAWDKGGAIFIQKDDSIAEAFQIVATLTGRATRVAKQTEFSEQRFSREPINLVRSKSVRHVEVRNARKNNVAYKGIVWCPSTDNGTVMARRNGKVYPTGQTWMRKNIANQITGMMEFKEMYSLIPKVMAGGPETDAMPEYMRNVGYFPIKELLGPKEGFIQMLWPNLPYMDINKIPLKFEISEAGIPIPKFEGKEILNDILSNAHPILKTAFEVLPEEGWDVYYRRPLGQEREAPRLLSKLSRVAAANPQLLQFLDGFLVNLGVEEGLSGKMDEKGRLMINAKLARVLDNNLPFLQKLNQYIELPEYLTEAVRSAREQTKDEKDAQVRAEKGLNVLSFYLGVKLKNLDEQAELGRQGDEILREAEEAYRKERKGKPEYQQARLRYVQQRLLRKRGFGLP